MYRVLSWSGRWQLWLISRLVITWHVFMTWDLGKLSLCAFLAC